MKNITKKIYFSRDMMVFIIVFATFTVNVHAASFDCAEAGTDVEKIICANTELSKLDEKLSKLYKEIFIKIPDEESFKQSQRKWIEWRNRCNDITCIRDRYMERIEALNQENQFKSEESYSLVMSKNDKLCDHMLDLFNEDISKYGWNGDSHQEKHEEFKRIPWGQARFSSEIHGHTEYTNVDGALFDFDNDGVNDFVVRWKSSLSNARADLLYIYGKELSDLRNDLSADQLANAKKKIYLAGWFYDLKPPFGSMQGVQVLEPFIYKNISYLVMRPLFEEQSGKTGYTVISKYKDGRLLPRQPLGDIEDICYYRRNREKQIHR